MSLDIFRRLAERRQTAMTGAERIDDMMENGSDEDDAAAIEAYALKEREAFCREVVNNLRPTARIIFTRLIEQLPTRTRRAIADRRPTLLILRIPSQDWTEVVTDALDAMLTTCCHDAVRKSVYGSTSLPRSHKSSRLEADAILTDLYRGTVCCLLAEGDELPDRLTPFVDFDFRVEPFTADAIASALSRRFPEQSAGSLLERLPTSLAPTLIDLVLQKAADIDEAVRMFRALAGTGDVSSLAVDEDRPAGSGPRLNELHGYGEAREWGQQLVADLESFRSGHIRWADVDSGCLLVGPPGTGKTLFASALALSAGCAFFPTSYADWQSSRSGHLGDLMKRMRQVFTDAAQQTPAIVFIDEIDTLPARGSTERNDDWWRSIINGLLECLDGSGRREGVVILAACNDGTRLDPALVRSGRLDRRFRIELPDAAALIGIFRNHLGEGLSDDVVQPIATALAGTTSGADVVRIARDARRLARQAGRPVEGGDLLAAALPPETRPAGVLRRVAIHEAGHAVVRMVFGGMPLSLSLVCDGLSAGGVVLDFDEGSIQGLRRDIEALIVPILAGRAAEEVILGSVSAGAGGSDTSDLARATAMLMQIESTLGLGSFLSFGMQVDGGTVEIKLRRLYAEAQMLVSRHRTAIIELADLALTRRVLGRSALEEFSKKHCF